MWRDNYDKYVDTQMQTKNMYRYQTDERIDTDKWMNRIIDIEITLCIKIQKCKGLQKRVQGNYFE